MDSLVYTDHKRSCRPAVPCLLCIVLTGEKVAVPRFVVI